MVGLLASLDDVGTRITAAYARLKALRVGSIELPGGGEIATLRSEGRRFSGQLASQLGIAIRHDVWGGTGPRQPAGPQGLQNTPGNYYQHG